MNDAGAQKTLQVVIVDDEEPARHILREYLSSMDPPVQILAECGNGFDAVKAAAELKPELLLLDIQMPRLDGFEVMELLGREQPVIFITAYDQHALKAFEVNAVDYLLKPFSSERLVLALARARQRMGRKEAMPLDDLLVSARPEGKMLDRILVRDGSKVHIILTQKVDYLQAQDDYVNVRSEGKNHLKQQPLAQLETLLDPGRFLRVHRSYVINIERLVRLEPQTKDTWVAILTDGSRIPVSRAGYVRLKTLL